MTFVEAFQQAAEELGWSKEQAQAAIARALATDEIAAACQADVIPAGKEREYTETAKALGVMLGFMKVGCSSRPDLN